MKLDDINILNIDKKDVKFRIEIKKENKKEKFKQIYEGKDNDYLIENLEKNTNYEIKLCSVYNELISNYTQIYKIKTNNIDSIILNETEKGDEFLNQLYEWTGYKGIELLYRGSKDGTYSNIFHNKCDNKGPTLCLCKNDKGNIFGGYTSVSWTSRQNYYTDYNSFLFTLTNIYGIAPTKFPIFQNQDKAVYHGGQYGPIFGGGHDLYIRNDYPNKKAYSNIGHTYQDVLGKGRSIFTGDKSNNDSDFILKELEIFKLK